MLTITMKTDQPEAVIGLYDDDIEIEVYRWLAHRQLAETLHTQVQALLTRAGKDWSDVNAVVVFKGPGSFTGLRIGSTVANALADSLNLKIVGTMGDDWVAAGLQRLQRGETDSTVIPEYGALPHITQQKK